MNTTNPSNFDQNKIINLYRMVIADALKSIKSFQEIYPYSEFYLIFRRCLS